MRLVETAGVIHHAILPCARAPRATKSVSREAESSAPSAEGALFAKGKPHTEPRRPREESGEPRGGVFGAERGRRWREIRPRISKNAMNFK